jgi:N-acetylglutamate synthase-like GNAT family acetyltransferase
MVVMTVLCPTFEVPHGGSDYLELVRLRDLHLRQPIGLRLQDEDLAGEERQRHFAIKEAGSIVGGLIAVHLSPDSMKLRQMWVLPELQGQGHGRDLLQTVEQVLRLDGISHFTLHARRDAVGFYRKCGYEPVGGTFVEVGIPHQRMDKFV